MEPQRNVRLTASVAVASILASLVAAVAPAAATTTNTATAVGAVRYGEPAPQHIRRLAHPPSGWRQVMGDQSPSDRAALLRRVHRRWWGVEIVLRTRVVRRINKVITMGAGVAGLVSVLSAAGVISSPAAIPTGVAAAVLTLGRAAIAVCNWNSRGIRLLVPRMAPVAVCVPR